MLYKVTSVRVFIVVVMLVNSACAISPQLRMTQYAQQHGLQKNIELSAQFKHVIFRNYLLDALPASPEALPEVLNVYLEGDGSPWVFRYFITSDPTPRRALMLELMSTDTNPSIYIGRPCYNGFATTPPCESTRWTSGRYSTSVVNSMVAVLVAEIDRLGINRINVFGHSGGGTLAMLIAERVNQVVRVVTLAGNLDVGAWISHHSYTPLYSSLDPAVRSPLRASVEQIHFMGANDTNIPPALARSWVKRQRNSYGIVIDKFTHGCCWEQVWPTILEKLDRGRPYQFPGSPFKLPWDIERSRINAAAYMR